MKKGILVIGVVGIVIAAFVFMFYPKPRPDLGVYWRYVEPSNVEIGQYFKAEAWVRNMGKGKSGNFKVKVYFHSPFYEDYTLGDASVYGLNQNEEKKVFFRDDLRLWDEGVHQIVIEVEPTGFTDKDYTNNEKAYQITVVASPELPDLAIAGIYIYPQRPQAGKFFSAEVSVKNIGNVASGNYDVRIWIKNISRGDIYPLGTYRQGPIQPGQHDVVWQSNTVAVYPAGSYQLHAEITPYQFTDENDINNMLGWSFTVTP